MKLSKDNIVENATYPTTICNDIQSLIDKVIAERNLPADDALVRVGIDGGGGFLKICVSIFDIHNQHSTSTNFKDSGVKRIFIVAITPNVQENYVNCKKLWNAVGLH